MFSFWSSAKPPAQEAPRQPAPNSITISPSPPAIATATPAQSQPHPQPQAQPQSQAQALQQQQQRDVLGRRSLKQLGVFFTGAGFLVLSTLVTRRAVTRRRLADVPKFYSRSSPGAVAGPGPAATMGGAAAGGGAAAAAEGTAAAGAGAEGALGASGPLMAIEALNLATINVLSFGVMLAGGVAWAFDISSLDELKAHARRAIRGPGSEMGGAARTDEEAEREVEEWVARVLARKGTAQNRVASEQVVVRPGEVQVVVRGDR